MSRENERTWQAGPVRVRVTLPPRKDPPKPRLTTERIVDTAMELLAKDGYDAVSMRSLARALDTGPASLYAHIANKEQLDHLVLDRIASQLELPEPDPERWQEQLKTLLRDMLQLYRAHPGAARAVMATVPTTESVLRATDGILAIALSGGVSPQAAAWFCDLASLYVAAIAYEESIWATRFANPHDGEAEDHEQLDEEMRQAMEAAAAQFPLVRQLANELTRGDGDDRFEFGIDVLVSGLHAASERYR
jgi:AcrR family transcriptional regulator